MKNFVQKGDYLTFTAASPVASGEAVVEGAIFGVAATAAATGADFEAAITGVFDLPKAAGALTKGQKAYWDGTAGNVTGTATGNTLIGATTVCGPTGQCRAV